MKVEGSEGGRKMWKSGNRKKERWIDMKEEEGDKEYVVVMVMVVVVVVVNGVED